MNHHVPRREPRVLALDTNAASLAYVVADLVELRSSGEEPFSTPRSLRLRLGRLVRRERPTAIVTSHPDAVGRLLGRGRDYVAVTEAPRTPLPFSAIADVYAEAAVFAPNARLQRLARLAVTALARSSFPSRKYAKTHRTRTPLRPRRQP